MAARESKGRTGALLSLLASRRFFVWVIALFILEALWIAFSGRYPMAFDEDFHLGIIRIYAHHLSPFLAGQPPGSDAFGPVARDPSYLYQYLMSFPYRLVSVFTSDQTIQVLFLRIINIGLFAWGLVLWRRLLARTRASRRLINFVMLLFVIIPVAPLLAAQINYDNLLFPLTALALLWAADLSRPGKDGVDVSLLLKLLILCLLTSLVKYAFLPIFAAIFIYLAFLYVKSHGWRGTAASLGAGLRRINRAAALGLTAGLILASVLFGQRYGINLARYHTPVPSCEKILTDERCDAYGPWSRDHYDESIKKGSSDNPLVFSADWFYGMWLRLFFALGGPDVGFQTTGPLPVPGIAAIVVTLAGAASMAAYGKRVLSTYDGRILGLLLLTAAFYVAALWLDEFRSYVRTGQAVAINGRYLFPILLPLMLMGALSFAEFCRGKREWIKPAAAGLTVICLIWGGGALTYILRSNDSWSWPSPAVRSANHAVKAVIGPITPGYHDTTEFL